MAATAQADATRPGRNPSGPRRPLPSVTPIRTGRMSLPIAFARARITVKPRPARSSGLSRSPRRRTGQAPSTRTHRPPARGRGGGGAGRQGGDEGARLREPGGPAHVAVARLGLELDVLADRGGEQEAVLEHDGYVLSQPGRVYGAPGHASAPHGHEVGVGPGA